jgi:hypothetical protein
VRPYNEESGKKRILLRRDRKVKTLLGILILALIVGGPVPEGLGNTMEWYYWSPITVVETINNLGGGSYRYNYSFVNVDVSPIWHFGINTTFITQGMTGGTKFTGHDSWWSPPDWLSVSEMYYRYDARNIDPAIVGTTNTSSYSPTFDAIQVGEAASGYSFTASIYDPSPKYYYYETIASGYTRTNGTGKVAAVGLTVPEPGTVLLVGLGSLALMRRRRA